MSCSNVPLDQMFLDAMSVLECTEVPEPAHTVDLNLRKGTIKVTYDSGPIYEGKITSFSNPEDGQGSIGFEVREPKFTGIVIFRYIPYQLSSKLAYL